MNEDLLQFAEAVRMFLSGQRNNSHTILVGQAVFEKHFPVTHEPTMRLIVTNVDGKYHFDYADDWADKDLPDVDENLIVESPSCALVKNAESADSANA